MQGIEDNEPAAPRHYVAVRVPPEDHKALRVLAAMERRSLGGYMEALLAREIEQRAEDMERYVTKIAKQRKQQADKEHRSAA